MLQALLSNYWFVEGKVARQSFMKAVITNHTDVYLREHQKASNYQQKFSPNQTIIMSMGRLKRKHIMWYKII